MLERMATEEAGFEDAFSSPVFAPTRDSILTVLYPNGNGLP